jgi:hypothetical protein
LSKELGLFPPSWLSLFSSGLLTWDNNKDQQSVHHEVFVSFEDALWCFLKAAPIDKKTFLVPDFFCTDVTSRLIEQGFSVVWYALNEDLSFNQDTFKNFISDDVGGVFIYYPMGCRDTTPKPEWFRSILGPNVLIIEDCADCVVLSDQICLIDSKHILIDSLRKILPLQGARLFFDSKINLPNSSSGLFYFLKTHLLHISYLILHSITEVTAYRWLLNIKWNIFVWHSNSIGSHFEGVRGSPLFEYFLSKINLRSLKTKRGTLVKRYYQNLSPTISSSNIKLLPQEPKEEGEIRFPILCGNKNTLSILADKLEQFEIYVDLHFDDSPRAQMADYLLLPLTPCMNIEDIDKISSSILKILNNKYQ